MFKKILSLFIILISLTGCKAENFKDKIIGFTDKNESLKQPPYVWSDFKDQGLITERKIQIEGEVANPALIHDGIIYINRSSGTDELFFYNIKQNTIMQLTARGKAGKKSPIYALRVHNVLYKNGNGTMVPSETKSFAWIEKGDTENKWEIYYGETYGYQSFEAIKIHDFIIPSSDTGKINTYVESLQINSQYVIWAEPTEKVYASEPNWYCKNCNSQKWQLVRPTSDKFRVFDDRIVYYYGGSYYAAEIFSENSYGLTDKAWRIPFLRGNSAIWQPDFFSKYVMFRNLDTPSQILLSFERLHNNNITLDEVQDDILYLKDQHTVYALDMLTLKRADIPLPSNRLTNVNYYKNRFVTSQTNGNKTELYLYEVSF